MAGKTHKTRKSLPSGTSPDVRQLGVLIERVDDHVGLIAEQYGDIKKTLGTHTEMIASVKTDLEMMKADVEIVKDDLGLIKHSLKQKVDVDEFAALERRVASLEKRGVR